MSLQEVWETSKAPFYPVVPKERQFTVGFTLLLSALILTGLFALNRSLKNIPLLGIPASLAFGFGAVYMICAVGVYV
ncbi:hypothetical protein VTN49DRAFT_707 [Thermomyces lanuginosus]|uniref:uncharacterized protein n=1 Tax=Thermomyces lanuginosus TaxID=5541 RepID=UPI003743912E